jgi:prepilin-type N-terminal cleavage/methylation domain-containing protein
MNTFRSDNGFTLLEVLIALAIFSVVGMVSLQTYLTSIRHVQIVNEEKVYTLLSMSKIEELKIEMTDTVEEEDGVFPEPYEEYEWSLELSDLSIADTEYGITFIPYELTLRRGETRFSTITPFLKVEEEGTVEVMQ